MISTTPLTITAAANIIRVVSGSLAITNPSSTAITGFTYAYVLTRAGVLTCSSHTYAVNATIEPNTTR